MDQNSSDSLKIIRKNMRNAVLMDEATILENLVKNTDILRSVYPFIPDGVNPLISETAQELVKKVRDSKKSGLMEVFLAEYGLSTKEGVALMCLAEALLRVPDTVTMDALIEDKILSSDWSAHIGHSGSPLVNASTWALMLTGKVLKEDDGIAGTLRALVKRVGEPVIRTATAQAMRELGQQFVLGQDIDKAMHRAKAKEADGFTYSYDMLGEAARTEADARRYHLAYSQAIGSIARHCNSEDSRQNPGISVKLSALHPRYEATQRARVLPDIINRTVALASLAKSANMGFNIDAEEQDRLDLSLDVIEAVLSDPALAGWDGFGVVVQAYGRRASYVIDWLYALAQKLDRKIMVRLVKGAYWDTEIKSAQVLGLESFPVFTRKPSTDVSYCACAEKLMAMRDRVFPQFATHNAHSIASVLGYAKRQAELGYGPETFEFQRLHGMGEVLHDIVQQEHGTKCRIYAPVGAHEDLLAYLVRRLLENGANSSFVNQIVDETVPVDVIVADPFEKVQAYLSAPKNQNITEPTLLYGERRPNAKGWDVSDHHDQLSVLRAMNSLANSVENAPLCKSMLSIAGQSADLSIPLAQVRNPAKSDEIIGLMTTQVPDEDLAFAIKQGREAAQKWSAQPVSHRADCLRKVADLYETKGADTFFALACQEAGKTAADAVAELREAIDFLRYYASEAERLGALQSVEGRGIIACISPWNFPLAIFTGQIAAALAAGNAVIAKPAEQTPLIAAYAHSLFCEAIPPELFSLLPGDGASIGAALASHSDIDGVCFTGSTNTAQHIHRALAKNAAPDVPFIAETGGLNAMIVDSSALPEQAVRDIVASAFQSAGQRCSALRMLYVQKDVAPKILTMLQGAMDALVVGDPADIGTDVGPVIDMTAKNKIEAHIAAAKADGRLLKQLKTPTEGYFVGPALIQLDGIDELKEEIFGPVLHVATFEANDLLSVVDDINNQGFGLTFGLHTRIDDRVQSIVDRIKCGNIYINRNQIGAIVGSQPFGGEGLSGTGPKAGGPQYLQRFCKSPPVSAVEPVEGKEIAQAEVQAAIDAINARNPKVEKALSVMDMPGPTGESNRLTNLPRGLVLCLGPGAEAAREQVALARIYKCPTLAIAPGLSGKGCLDGNLSADALGGELTGFSALACWANSDALREIKMVLSQRDGAIIPLICNRDFSICEKERHVCIDTTAAGGNASLLVESS